MIFAMLSAPVEPLIKKIHHHPFIRELAAGTLPQEKFITYVLQDALYLSDLAKTLGIAAARLPTQISKDFLHLAITAIEAEQTLHRDYLQKVNIDIPNVEKNPACFMYTHYRLNLATLGSIEEVVASLLPCFWIYQTVGTHIAQTQAANNPYHAWIAMYSSDAFQETVERVIQVTNQLGEEASVSLQNKMITAFKRATELEWLFWNDAYHQTPWLGEKSTC